MDNVVHNHQNETKEEEPSIDAESTDDSGESGNKRKFVTSENGEDEKERAKSRQLDTVNTSCPYLGSVNRHMLDFDFEKLCCISLSNVHVYCCLVCGKYFQGRGKGTYAYSHSLEFHHYVFMNLETCEVYILPDNYIVHDASLDDIRFYLQPTYEKDFVAKLGTTVMYGKALDGTDFLPGCIGLNNLKRTDYFNVVIQLLSNVIPVRNKLLVLNLTRKQNMDAVLLTLGELLRKIFNPKNFKGIVSPHEFLQTVGVASEKQFRIGHQRDPLALLVWLLERLHQKLKKKNSSVVKDSFEGELLVKKIPLTGTAQPKEYLQKFMFLTISLPPAPIFKDSLDRNMIPQVPIFDLLQKFDGVSKHLATQDNEHRCYSLFRLPKYLVMCMNRFSKNNFFLEKNPTIVTFPVKNLDLADYVHPDAVHFNPVTRYNLVCNICHEGSPTGNTGIYKIHVLHQPTNQWYEIEDLRVTQVLPQFVALSESYVQVYQRQDVLGDGSLDLEMIQKAAEEFKTEQGKKEIEQNMMIDDVDIF